MWSKFSPSFLQWREEYEKFSHSNSSPTAKVVSSVAYVGFALLLLLQNSSEEYVTQDRTGNLTITIVVLCATYFIVLAVALVRYFLKKPLLPHAVFLRYFVILGSTIVVAMTLVDKSIATNCVGNLYGLRTCKRQGELPCDLVIMCLSAPVIFGTIFKAARTDLMVISWLISNVTAISLIGALNATHTISLMVVCIPLSLSLIYENRRQNISAFYLVREYRRILSENEKLEEQARTQEFRHMVGNVAHDLKTPLSSFMSGVDTVAEIISECATPTELFEKKSFLRSTVNDIKNTNNFMLMTINRCIDFTKASKGVALVPKYETFCLRDALSLPMNCMTTVQHKIEISLDCADDLSGTFLISDKQWLQENLLCLLSNAVKYSSHGPICTRVYNVENIEAVTQRCGLHPYTAPAVSTPAAGGTNAIHGDGRRETNVSLSSSESGGGVVEGVKPKFKNKLLNIDTSLDGNQGRVKPNTPATMGTTTKSAPRSAAYYPTPDEEAEPSIQRMKLHSSSIDERIRLLDGNASGKEVELRLRHPSISSHESTSSTTRILIVEVEDHGIGIAPSEIPNLFNPFKQAQRMAGGTGLGLFSFAKRVEALKGLYGIEQRSDGKQGSIFWFAIPYRRDEEAQYLLGELKLAPTTPGGPIRETSFRRLANTSPRADDSQNNSSGPPFSRRFRVLLVDDSPTIQKMTSMVLRRQNYHVDQVENGADAVEKIINSNAEYDVVFMDLQMPIMDGLEATRRIRTFERQRNELLVHNAAARHQFIIGLSANSDTDTMNEAFAAGIDDFIGKPFTFAAFTAAYNKYMDSKMPITPPLPLASPKPHSAAT